jgi:uncharacterized protein (TIGR00375 family)
MSFIADLHIHSRYSRATSRDCSPENLDYWSRRKGISLLGTGDFTHALWRKELSDKLKSIGDGFYVLKDEYLQPCDVSGIQPRFVVSGEISSIYKKNGKTRKVHNVIILPGLEAAQKLSTQLEKIGNLHSDGRPILGLDSKNLLEITLTACPEALFIPAHIWTPHFSVLGANSGFDSIEECFEDLTPHIFALETGLSSDPPMNWRLSALDRFALVSNSDAHSPSNLAREANIFDCPLTYAAFYAALKNNDRKAFAGTIEFYPEEGKYHFDGHRDCKIRWEPSRTIEADGICPVCNKKLTVGVLHRVEKLADRPVGYVPRFKRTFESLVPLAQVVSGCLGVGVKSLKVTREYNRLLAALGSELHILREVSLEDITAVAGEHIAEGKRRTRTGELHILAGFDGEFGTVALFPDAGI